MQIWIEQDKTIQRVIYNMERAQVEQTIGYLNKEVIIPKQGRSNRLKLGFNSRDSKFMCKI